MPAHRQRSHLRHLIAAAVLLSCCAAGLRAQGNFEVQVYGSELVHPGDTMVELHSNFTARGVRDKIDGVLPTNRADELASRAARERTGGSK